MKENFAPRVKGMTFIALTEFRFPLLVLNNIDALFHGDFAAVLKLNMLCFENLRKELWFLVKSLSCLG